MTLFKKKTHPFKTAVKDRNTEIDDAASKMLMLSRRIEKAIGGWTEQDHENNDMVFEAGDYLIESRCCRILNSWINLFIVCPKSVGGKVGWSNVSHNEFPEGWEYYPAGTCTVVCPSYEIADDIIKAVKELKE